MGVGLSAVFGSKDGARERERYGLKMALLNVDEQCVQVLGEQNKFTVAILNFVFSIRKVDNILTKYLI